MERLLKPEEVAEMLDVKVKTLLYGRLSEQIPKVRILNKTRYRERDIEKYIEKSTVNPYANNLTSKQKYIY